MNKKIRLNTLTKKSILLNAFFGLLFILIINFFLPDIMYKALKPYLLSHISSVINANTVRQSYIWRGNELAYYITGNKKIETLLQEYYDSNDKLKISEEIGANLFTRKVGKAETKSASEEGAITAVSNLMIYTENGDAFYNPDAAEVASVVINSDWINDIYHLKNFSYSPVISGEINNELREVICFARMFMSGNTKCYAIHMLDFIYIKNQFKDLIDLNIEDYQFIWSDQIIYRNLKESSLMNIDDYPDYMFNGMQYQPVILEKTDGIHFTTLVSYEHEQFWLSVYANKETLLLPYKGIFIIIQIMLYSVVLVLTILSSFTLKSMLQRLTNLVQKMRSVKDENYNAVLNDSSTDEIGELARTFNLMIETIRQDIENKLAFEKREQQMRYSLLVSAIDPHFVYNTLNTITFLAKMNKTEDIVSVNKALIGTLKDRLTMKNCKIFDSVKVEKEVLEQYMIIQQYMLHNTIQYSFNVVPEDLNLQIPKNILQPIVENSIKHGIMSHKNLQTRKIVEGKIEINILSIENIIKISISDNGSGISEDDIKKYFVDKPHDISESDNEHIGIHNIRMRLSFIYNDEYSIKVNSVKDEGTVIIIKIPNIIQH